MAASPAPLEGQAELVTVRLSDVPAALRERVAERLVDAWAQAGATASELLRLQLAALNANPDARLEVPRWKAERVLGGKQPVGPMPPELLVPSTSREPRP